jgi:CRISPR-associated endoribonuclease Cas6/Csy4 subtype I-F
MKDFIEISPVETVISSSGFIHYRRERNAIRTEATIQRELRRTLRRHPEKALTEAELADRRATISDKNDLPHVSMRSGSSKQSFSIRFDPVMQEMESLGEGFYSYGFGKNGATVPNIPEGRI